MEFLHPSKDDMDLIILLLVISRKGKSRLLCYTWDSSLPLHSADLETVSFPLTSEQSLPLLLIPVVHLTAFMLIYEGQSIFFKDILTGSPQRILQPFTLQPEPEELAVGRRAPIWVSWARVIRNTRKYRNKDDGIFLCREDGILLYLAIDTGTAQMLSTRTEVDRLGVNVDTSFAVLDVGPQKYDLLAAGGDGSEGGLWCFQARENGKCLLKSLTTAPMHDVTITDLMKNTSQATNSGSTEGQQMLKRMFACVGRGKYGSVTEFRHGLPATRQFTVPLSRLLDEGVLAVAALNSLTHSTSFIFLSLPKRTYLLLIEPATDQSDGPEPHLVDDHPHLDLHNRTIAARLTSKDQIIQITEGSIRRLKAFDEGGSSSSIPLKHSFKHARISMACIGTGPNETIALTAINRGGGFGLVLGNVGAEYNALWEIDVGLSLPCALCMASFGDVTVAIVGFTDKTVRIYGASDPDNNAANEMFRWPVEEPQESNLAACESIAISVQEQNSSSLQHNSIIACGLRNGFVALFSLEYQDNIGTTQYLHSLRLADH